MAAKKKLRESEYEHPSVDYSCRFALDHLIRQHGFTIYSRCGRDVLWLSRKRVIMRQSKVLKMIPQDRIDDALYMEDLYMQGKCA